MHNTAFLVALIALGTAIPSDCLPETARASQQVTLQTKFIPDRLGEATTIEFGFRISSVTPGQVPSPVTEVNLDLPAGMGLATSHSASPSARPQYCSNKDPRAAQPTHPSPPNSSSQDSYSPHHQLATAGAWTPQYHSSQPGPMVPT